MSSSNHISKYRPVLTASNINHILSLAKKDMTQESISIISVLAPFEWKIKNASISPSHVTAPKPSLSESCGLEITTYEVNKSDDLWHRYKESPASMTLAEINEALAYGYLNDLMTSEEEIAYQNSVIEVDNPALIK